LAIKGNNILEGMDMKEHTENTVTGQCEMVMVPRRPTAEMLKAGWYEANDENAAGVWRDMIEAWELAIKRGEYLGGKREIS
jgi:hypothetical protein